MDRQLAIARLLVERLCGKLRDSCRERREPPYRRSMNLIVKRIIQRKYLITRLCRHRYSTHAAKRSVLATFATLCKATTLTAPVRERIIYAVAARVGDSRSR